MKLKRIHHVAYRCNDAKETVEFYERVLNMEFMLAFAEDQVPSTKEPDPYMHVFLDAGMGNVLAFFELPTRPEMDRDHNTPEWVQHLAFELDDYEALLAAKAHIEAEGIDVLGPTNHGIFQSIYFFDPKWPPARARCQYADPGTDRRAQTRRTGYARGMEPHQEGTAPRSLAARTRIPGH